MTPSPVIYTPTGGATVETFTPRDHGAVFDGTTDDSAAIAAAYDAMKVNGHASGRLIIDGPCYIASPLVFDGGYSNVTAGANWTAGAGEQFALDTTGGVIKAAANIGCAVTVKGHYGAKVIANFKGGGASRSVTNAAITAASNVLTSATAAFTSVDMGKVVRVEGAGIFGEVPLFARIASVTNGTTVVLDNNAAVTVSGAKCSIRDIALHVENLIDAEIEVAANAFAGLVFHHDGAQSSTTAIVTQSTLRSVKALSCGQAVLFQYGQGGFGLIEDVWDDNCVDGSALVNCADLTIGHWENYSPGTQTVGLLIDTPNNLNGSGAISLGDSATEAQCKIVGASDAGSFNRIRVSGHTSGSAYDALKLVEVKSIAIDNVDSTKGAAGIHIKGGGQNGINIKNHFARSGDVVGVKIEAGPSSSAPFIQLGGYWRFITNQAIQVLSSITGGRLILRGLVDSNNNSSGTVTNYLVDCQSTAMVVDVAGLTQKYIATVAGGVNHVNPVNLLGADLAHLDNGANPTGKPVALRTWLSALADRDSNPANVVFLGDSVTEGQGATTYTKRWVDRVANQLRKRFSVAGAPGIAGSTYIPAYFASSTIAASNPWVLAGSPVTAGNDGIGNRYVRLTSGTTKATITVTATSVDLFWAKGSSGAIGYYKVDGGSAVTVDTGAFTNTEGNVTSISLGTPAGPHTIEVGWSSGGTVNFEGASVYSGNEAKGLRFYDWGHSGVAASDLAGGNYAAAITGLMGLLNPHLVVINLGLNDQNTARTPAQFQTDLSSVISNVKSSITGAGHHTPSILLLANYPSNGSYTYPWAQYVAAIKRVAAADANIQVLDLGLHFADQATDSALAMTYDAVHPSDKGHAFIASLVADAISPSVDLTNLLSQSTNNTTVLSEGLRGYLGETIPAFLGSTSRSPITGKPRVLAIPVPNTITVSNLSAFVWTAGATLTAGQNLMALYDSSGNLLGSTADQTTAFGTTGLKTAAITPVTIVGGPGVYVYAYLLSTGTTPASFASFNNGQPTLVNAGMPANAWISAGANSTISGAPATITLSAFAAFQDITWMALS